MDGYAPVVEPVSLSRNSALIRKPGTPKCCGSVVKDAVELNGWISYLPCTVPENLTGPNVPGKIDRPVTGHTTPTGGINGAVPPT
jgi:hypothetical protein